MWVDIGLFVFFDFYGLDKVEWVLCNGIGLLKVIIGNWLNIKIKNWLLD